MLLPVHVQRESLSHGSFLPGRFLLWLRGLHEGGRTRSHFVCAGMRNSLSASSALKPGPKCVSEAASPSFDHLVSAGEERSRHVEAERLGSLEIDEQLNFRCLLDREIRRIGARKDPAGMDPTLIAPVNITASVADEAARRSELAKLVDRGYSVANGERGELSTPAREEQITPNHERLGS